MGLGPGELALILFIAYVVVGPEDMGKLARTLARTLREIRKLSTDLSEEVKKGTAIPEVLPGEKTKAQDPAAFAASETGVSESVSEMESVLREIRKAEELIS